MRGESGAAGEPAGTEGTLAITARGVTVVAYYDRTFEKLGDKAEGWPAWRSRSVALRPDVTLEVRMLDRTFYVLVDAKYKVERLGPILFNDDPLPETPDQSVSQIATFQPDDLTRCIPIETRSLALVQLSPSIGIELPSATD